ncbi:hypothetical protein [Corallococcus llansteffanensis]|uniref:Alpha/beta hydrolase n=1 Tax=Corallococcus llansteffanensis TaxID=2316731 RepID=A0A3A8QRB3_9BACT|nr:hypothetical protein [Corallococcus llansteffanensis]RKH68915.1 hypothetical protein D7V93_00680 [Corallococcus llansteffanensis]
MTEKQPIDWIASFQEAVSVGVPKGVPVVALVADQQDLPDWEPWLASQRKLVAGGAPGEVVLVERSGHHIPRDRPDAVAEAIHRLLPRASEEEKE